MRRFVIAVLVSAYCGTPATGAAQSASDALARGREHLAAGRLGEALVAFRAAVSADSTNAPAWNGLGATLNRLEQYQDALVAQERAVQLDSTNVGMRFNRALVYLEHGRASDALRDLDFVVAQRPAFAPGWTERGTALAILDDTIAARRDWDRALTLDSSYVWPHFYRAQQALVEGKFLDAAVDLDVVTAREQLLSAHLFRWVAYRRLGRHAPPLARATQWPGPIADFLRGEITTEELLDAARRHALSIDDRRLASAWFFIAQKHFAEARVREGTVALQEVVALRVPRLAEVRAAEAALRRGQ